MPKISVIITTYERPDFLPGAIQTVVEQSYDDLEIIVVDGGSDTEYAPEIVTDFPDYVSCICCSEDNGLSATRNTGINAAKGEYIAFLDDDDRWHRTKLEKQLKVIEAAEDIGMVTCLLAAFQPEGDFIHYEKTLPTGNLLDQVLVSPTLGTPSRILVSKECLEDVGYWDESLRTREDWDFYIRVCQNWCVEGVREYLCFRRSHESLSSSSEAQVRDSQAVLKKHEDTIREQGLWNLAIARTHARMGRACLESGELTEARRWLYSSFQKEPKVRTAALYILAFTHTVIIRSALHLKRTLETSTTSTEIDKQAIPGYPK